MVVTRGTSSFAPASRDEEEKEQKSWGGGRGHDYYEKVNRENQNQTTAKRCKMKEKNANCWMMKPAQRGVLLVM